MRIAGTEVNLKHKALEIYLSGCKEAHCPGCHNPELWDFAVGEDWKKVWPELEKKLSDLKKSGLVDIIWLLGGEPAHQDFLEICEFLEKLRISEIPVMLWSRERRLPEQILNRIAYAKLGPYLENGDSYTELLFGITLANREQKIVEIANVQKSIGAEARRGLLV